MFRFRNIPPMYFLKRFNIKYYMFNKKRIILLIIIAALCVAVPVMAVFTRKKNGVNAEGMQVITLWQIDGFEGGKGSRTQYLTKKAEKIFKGQNKYLHVDTLTADAARENLAAGTVPDIISCSPTFYGAESFVNHNYGDFKIWCNGAYCYLTLDENSNFDDINANNTVINVGKDNLSQVVGVIEGLYGVEYDATTNAYLKLLNGKYKYLLGTQRDVFRLITRGVNFKISAVTSFNDLYQGFCVTTKDAEKLNTCKSFVEYVCMHNDDINAVGLFSGGMGECEGNLLPLKNLKHTYELKALCGKDYLESLRSFAQSGELNKLKSLLK